MDLFRIYYLQCARRLPGLPEAHPCSRVHGHTFTIKVTLRGPIDPAYGWVMDFNAMDSAWRPVHDELDHRYLNDVAGLENPTSEALAVWLWRRLQSAMPYLASVSVMEGQDMGCIYHGPDTTS